MRFSVEHELPGSPARVAAILCEPAFHEGLDLPDLSRPEVVESSTLGPARLLRLRYEFTGHIDPVARKLLGRRRLTWIQELRLDTTTFQGRLAFAAEADPDRLYGEADVALAPRATSAESTVRTITGALHVRVPVIGGNAERRIVPGVVRRLDVEAAAVAAALEH